MNTTVQIFYLVAFVSSVLYAVLGNVVVHMLLTKKNIPVSFGSAGIPGYLYGICKKSQPSISICFCRFALSTNIAFFIGVLLGLFFPFILQG